MTDRECDVENDPMSGTLDDDEIYFILVAGGRFSPSPSLPVRHVTADLHSIKIQYWRRSHGFLSIQ